MTKWLLGLAILLSGCATGPTLVAYAVQPGDAMLLPRSEAKEMLTEVLRLARDDDPNRKNSRLEQIEVDDAFFAVTAFCYDVDGNSMGRSPYKRTYIQLAPRAYELVVPERRSVYFVKLDGAYTSNFDENYPSLQYGCLWFERSDEVDSLFEAIACLKESSSAN